MSETENVPASECWFECGALGGGTDMGICLDYTDTDNTPCPDGVRTGGRTTKTLSEEAGSKQAGYTHQVRKFCEFEYIGDGSTPYDGMTADEKMGIKFSMDEQFLMPINSRLFLMLPYYTYFTIKVYVSSRSHLQ